MSLTVNLTGLDQLNRRMETLAKQEATKAGQIANRAGAAVLLKAAKARAPVGPTPEGAKITRKNKAGVTRQETHHKIVNSLKVRKVKSDKPTEVHNVVTTGRAYHASMEEFGSIHNAPNPFMRNSFDNSQQAIIDKMMQVLERQLIKRGA